MVTTWMVGSYALLLGFAPALRFLWFILPARENKFVKQNAQSEFVFWSLLLPGKN